VPPGPNKPEPRIAMWGAPSSGKTTFLAALSLALSRERTGWNVAGGNPASEEVLIKLTKSLSNQEFPAATAGIERYKWVLHGPVPLATGRKSRGEQRYESIRVGLDLIDASGEITGSNHFGLPLRDDLVDDVAHSRGIVFIFDPVREFEYGDAFDHTFGMLAQLARRMDEGSGRLDGRLPHYVAVCITKFDEVRVFETARRMDLLELKENDRHEFPRVNDEQARVLFTRLCEVSGSGNGEMVVNLLEQYFLPERIHYFVTSAIGFYVDRIRGFDPDDPQNILPDENEPSKPRVRGAVHPINIVEPLLWLGGQLVADRNAAGARR
jgi:Double-GTPase 2